MLRHRTGGRLLCHCHPLQQQQQQLPLACERYQFLMLRTLFWVLQLMTQPWLPAAALVTAAVGRKAVGLSLAVTQAPALVAAAMVVLLPHTQAPPLPRMQLTLQVLLLLQSVQLLALPGALVLLQPCMQVLLLLHQLSLMLSVLLAVVVMAAVGGLLHEAAAGATGPAAAIASRLCWGCGRKLDCCRTMSEQCVGFGSAG
jgi:hypothetical protein